MSTRDWRITWRGEFKTGTYFALNVQALGRQGASVVTVKARSLAGPPYFCETCISNACAHVDFVAEQDTPDSEAA